MKITRYTRNTILKTIDHAAGATMENNDIDIISVELTRAMIKQELIKVMNALENINGGHDYEN